MADDGNHLIELTLDDTKRIEALWLATGMVHDDAADQIRVLIERNPGLALGLESDGVLKACVFGIDEGYRGWIMRLGVDPSERRMGFGTRLVRELERRFQAIPLHYVALAAYTEATDAHDFWKSLGYGTTEFTMMNKRFAN